jgi:hypothetical protein
MKVNHLKQTNCPTCEYQWIYENSTLPTDVLLYETSGKVTHVECPYCEVIYEVDETL